MDYLRPYNGTIHGGMGHLIYDFLKAKSLAIPEKLQHIQHLDRFNYTIWRELLLNLEQDLQQPALGLEIARHVQPKHIGIIAYIAMSCDNLGQAMHRYHELHRLIFDGSPLEVETFNPYVAIRWAPLPFNMSALITDEIAIALMMEFLKYALTSADLHVHEVHFCHPTPKNVRVYEQYFHCKIRFNQEKSQLILPAQELSRPFKNSDSTLQLLLLQQAKSLIKQLPNLHLHSPLNIQQTILQGLQVGDFQIEAIAAQMNLSVRQLQRQLQQRDTTFQQLVQDIRHVMSKQYLQDTHMSLQEIALLLGYSEQSAFQRAFKQWTSMTPQQWRLNPSKYDLQNQLQQA